MKTIESNSIQILEQILCSTILDKTIFYTGTTGFELSIGKSQTSNMRRRTTNMKRNDNCLQ